LCVSLLLLEMAEEVQTERTEDEVETESSSDTTDARPDRSSRFLLFGSELIIMLFKVN